LACEGLADQFGFKPNMNDGARRTILRYSYCSPAYVRLNWSWSVRPQSRHILSECKFHGSLRTKSTSVSLPASSA